MTEEELKTKGRLATAVIAGSALTAGMFGVGLAPAAADTEENPEETVEETGGEAGDPGDIADEDSEENSEEGGTEGDGADDSDQEGGSDDDDDAAADDDGTSDDGDAEEGETLSEEVDVEEGADDLPVVTTPAPEERPEVNPEFDEFLVVDEETPIYDSSSEEFGEIIGYAAAGSYLQYYSSESNDPNAPGVRLSISDAYLEEALGTSFGYVDSDAVSAYDYAFEEVAPAEPERDRWNTVTIPEVEGVVYLVDDEPVTGEVQIPREGLSITAEPGTGYVLAEDADNWFSYSYTLTFDDLPGEVEQPEDWEADPEAWYSNAPESNLPEYSDEIRELGWAVDQDTENRLQQFEQGAPVYASPDLDSELLGGLTHTAGEEYWWGYLHESDFWMFWHQPTGAVGFVPGESYQGDEDLDDPEDVTDPPEGDDENGSSEDDGTSEDGGTEDEGTSEDDEDGTSDDDDDSVTPGGEGSDVPAEPFGSFEADVTEVAPGDDITLTATGLDAGESVEITLNPTLAEVEADENGEFTVTVTIPEDTEPGDYTITAQSLDREVSAKIDITVVEPLEPAGVSGGDVTVDPGAGGAPAPAPTDGLAVTGAEARTGIIAGALLALGAGLVAFANRARLFGRRQS